MKKLNLILVSILMIALLLIIPVNASLLVSTNPASNTNLSLYTGDQISVTFTGNENQRAFLHGLRYINSGSGGFDDLAYSPTGSRTYVFTVPNNYAGTHNGYTRFGYLKVDVTDDATHYADRAAGVQWNTRRADPVQPGKRGPTGRPARSWCLWKICEVKEGEK